MEMTNRRWLAIAALSCAALAALRLPPHGQPRELWSSWERLPERARAAKLHGQIADLNDAVSVLARRDTMLAAVRSTPDRTTPLFVATARLTAAERDTFERNIATQAATIGRGSRRIVLGAVIDSSGDIPKRVNYRTERQFLLPASTDGETCIAILRLGQGLRDLEPSAQRGIFGPCAFYGAFGPPGPAVESWLNERGHDVGFDAALPGRPEPNPGFLAIRKSTREEDLKRWIEFSRFSFRAYEASACASGDVDYCAKALRRGLGKRNRLVPDVAFPERPFWVPELPLGYEAQTFLADLLAEQGRARFEKFWTSPAADLETAFKSAFGQSTGEWTMRWMQYKYGKDTRGPYVSSRSALASLVASLALVGLSASLAYRRESA